MSTIITKGRLIGVGVTAGIVTLIGDILSYYVSSTFVFSGFGAMLLLVIYMFLALKNRGFESAGKKVALAVSLVCVTAMCTHIAVFIMLQTLSTWQDALNMLNLNTATFVLHGVAILGYFFVVIQFVFPDLGLAEQSHLAPHTQNL